jgi:hypothetical protein
MPKKKLNKLTAEQAAEKAKPNWRAVAPVRSDAATRTAADKTAPELERLRHKYPGTAGAPGVTAAPPTDRRARDLKMVVMEEKKPVDTHVGRKSVLVDKDGTIVGEQG